MAASGLQFYLYIQYEQKRRVLIKKTMSKSKKVENSHNFFFFQNSIARIKEKFINS